MKLDTLYKTDSKGKIRQWDVETIDKAGHSEIVVTHGIKDGAKVTKTTIISSGKNIGKSNETTCQKQAELEARSKWQKQMDDGYTTSPLIQSNTMLPMLAQRFDKHSNKISFPAYGQPKLDGIRCMGFHSGLQSRRGKLITAIPHLEGAVRDILSMPEFIDISFLDGELYSSILTFQEITSIVRKQDAPNNHQDIEYHVYDVFSSKNCLTFQERCAILEKLKNKSRFIKVVETVEVKDVYELQRYTLACVKQDYEGAMVRNAHGPYELDKRSYHLQKIKTFQDGEFKIIAGREDKDGGVVFTCECGSTTFDVRPEGTLAERAEYLKNINDIIGKELTVRYFEMTTSDQPVPRFPVGVSIRDYE